MVSVPLQSSESAKTSDSASAVPRIVIVGGGVAGLAVAVALARNRIPSLVLEARTRRNSSDKGDVLHENSIRILAEWGLYDSLVEHGALAIPAFHVLNEQGDLLLRFDFERDLVPPARVMSLRHAEIEELLESAAMSTGYVRLAQGESAHDLLIEKGRVTAVLTRRGTVEADLVVLANGRFGRLGRRFFQQRHRHDYSIRFYNLRVKYADANLTGTYVLGKHGLLVLVPLPNGELRIGIQSRFSKGDRHIGIDDLRAIIAQRLQGFPIGKLEVVSVEVYPLVSFLLESSWRPGAVVVGDAAHTVHPAGGQGMNLAFKDAQALAKALSSIASSGWKRDAIDRSLESYSREQAKDALPVFRRTHFLGKCGAFEGHWAALATRVALRLFNCLPPLKRTLFARVVGVR